MWFSWTIQCKFIITILCLYIEIMYTLIMWHFFSPAKSNTINNFFVELDFIYFGKVLLKHIYFLLEVWTHKLTLIKFKMYD